MIDADRDSVIGRDMERVFQDVAPSKARARQDLVVTAGRHPSRNARREHWFLISVPLIVALLVIGLAVRGGLQIGQRLELTARHVNPPRHQPGESPGVAQVTVPTPALVTTKFAGPQRIASAEVAPALPVQGIRHAEPIGPKRSTERNADIQRTGSNPVLDEPCSRDASTNECIYQDVLAADRRLRMAYDDAVRAGTPTSRLAWVNREWRQARSDSLDHPDETIRRYNALVGELDDLSSAVAP
ncbi:hypothetical protein [uncultured Sphingomonas sp.]|uniref:hypothetical protein n=1 Tax=uncultured Sphingomonas sp. TaxID=158754 RepID=UPI0035CB4F17